MSSDERAAAQPENSEPRGPATKKEFKTPWGAIAVVATLVLSSVLGIYTCRGIARAQGGFQADLWRSGVATVADCTINGLSLGLRYICSGDVSWEKQEDLPRGVTLPEPPYDIYSPGELKPGSTVAVEAFLVDRTSLVGEGSRTVVEEEIVTTDHPRGNEFWMLFQVFGPILWTILTFVVLGFVTTMIDRHGFGRSTRIVRRR